MRLHAADASDPLAFEVRHERLTRARRLRARPGRPGRVAAHGIRAAGLPAPAPPPARGEPAAVGSGGSRGVGGRGLGSVGAATAAEEADVSELSGVALVTGGGRGIGRSIALELAGAGMQVAVSARTREEVEQTASEAGGLAVQADVSRREDVERMVAEVERGLGPVDLLVANAGIARWEEAAWEDDPDGWWQRLRGERPRRVPLRAGGAPGDDRARPRPDREHGQRRRLPAGTRRTPRTARARRRSTASARRSRTSSSRTGSPSSRSARGSSRRR